MVAAIVLAVLTGSVAAVNLVVGGIALYWRIESPGTVSPTIYFVLAGISTAVCVISIVLTFVFERALKNWITEDVKE
jgi:hypothetical protein